MCGEEIVTAIYVNCQISWQNLSKRPAGRDHKSQNSKSTRAMPSTFVPIMYRQNDTKLGV